MIDLTRRRFVFGLAAVPLVVPAVKHFVMPRWEPVGVYTPHSIIGEGQDGLYTAEFTRNGRVEYAHALAKIPTETERLAILANMERKVRADGVRRHDYFSFMETVHRAISESAKRSVTVTIT